LNLTIIEITIFGDTLLNLISSHSGKNEDFSQKNTSPRKTGNSRTNVEPQGVQAKYPP